MVSRLTSTPNRVGLIGFGAIGSEVCRQLNHLKAAAPAIVTSVLVRDRAKAEKALEQLQLSHLSKTADQSQSSPPVVDIFDNSDHF